MGTQITVALRPLCALALSEARVCVCVQVEGYVVLLSVLTFQSLVTKTGATSWMRSQTGASEEHFHVQQSVITGTSRTDVSAAEGCGTTGCSEYGRLHLH